MFSVTEVDERRRRPAYRTETRALRSALRQVQVDGKARVVVRCIAGCDDEVVWLLRAMGDNIVIEGSRAC